MCSSDLPRPALLADDVSALQVAGLSGEEEHAGGPVVWLHDVRGGLVQGSLAPEGVGVFLRVTGERTRGVTLVGNAYRARGPVELAPEIAPEAVVHVADAPPDRAAPVDGERSRRPG